MSSNAHSPNVSPDSLLPAQLGIVLVRRPTLGHAAATLVHLAERRLLTISGPGETETASGGDTIGWTVGSAVSRDSRRRDPLTRFETALLDGLPEKSHPLPLSEDTAEDIAPALHKFATELVKDAVHHGWLRHLHHDQLTAVGEELADRARKFRAELRRASADGHPETLNEHLPYALMFGLVTPGRTPAAEATCARFAAAFISACSGLPDWQHHDPKHEFPDIDTWSRNEWRGLPPGGRVAGYY